MSSDRKAVTNIISMLSAISAGLEGGTILPDFVLEVRGGTVQKFEQRNAEAPAPSSVRWNKLAEAGGLSA